MNRNQILCSLVTGISFLIGPIMLSAQEISELPGAQLATQGLGRPYWHVFIAYAIAIGIVFFWVVSIGRRLSQIEKKIGN
ncbi:MAG: hypothetical protein MK243_03920 [Gemmatimonadetes bacterium]|jgi:hypothetical protein|nr:hypothetical protein [Gemmatimonadota bacterium]